MFTCENGVLVEVERTDDMENIPVSEEPSKIEELIQGLSQATTVSQIRNVAKGILACSEGEKK